MRNLNRGESNSEVDSTTDRNSHEKRGAQNFHGMFRAIGGRETICVGGSKARDTDTRDYKGTITKTQVRFKQDITGWTSIIRKKKEKEPESHLQPWA